MIVLTTSHMYREPFPVGCRQQRSEKYFASSKRLKSNRPMYFVLLYTHCQCMEQVNRKGGIHPSTICTAHSPLPLPLRLHRCWAISHFDSLSNQSGRQSSWLGRGGIVGLFEVALFATYGSVGGYTKTKVPILIHECGSCRLLSHHPVAAWKYWYSGNCAHKAQARLLWHELVAIRRNVEDRHGRADL